MRRHHFWMVSLLALGLGACTTFRTPPLEPAKAEPAKACANWRWIGISRPEAQCPEIPGWTVRPLFPQLAPVRQKSGGYCDQDSDKVPSLELIGELNRFCVYEAKDKRLGDSLFPPVASTELVRLDQDCAALSTSGETKQTSEAWRDSFRRLQTQVGLPQVMLPVADPLSVRLAFLDTEPTREELPRRDQPRRSPHGYTLAHVARHLVCPGGNCAAQITTQLALPIIEFDAKHRKLTKTDTVQGGYLGMQSDLAVAIWKAVDAWKKNRKEGSHQHLVLNLSLAWDPELFSGLDEDSVDEMKAGTQAVYRALQYAAGFDALVLAAAGNQKGEPCNNFGPLLPAAWESRAPQEKCCGELCQKAQPLLYAVGGVDSSGQPLVNARRGGMPPRAAYGENSAVASLESDKPTASLTGSSVATAVVSSIAAVVWASFPHLTSAQVMEVLDESGDPLDLPASFGVRASASLATSGKQRVHRLSLCSALLKACEKHGPCHPQPSCDPWTPELSVSASAFRSKTWVPDSCQPWLYPQPQSPPCMSCGPPDTPLK